MVIATNIEVLDFNEDHSRRLLKQLIPQESELLAEVVYFYHPAELKTDLFFSAGICALREKNAAKFSPADFADFAY